MIEIAKAVKQDAQVLIMDEPSAPLTSSVESMFKVCQLLKSQGVSIIYISHRLDEVMYLSDRIVVLRDGEYIDTLITSETNVDELIRLMVGRDLKESYPPRDVKINSEEIVLELQNVSGNGTEDINLKVRKGEVLGLGGLVGAGRTELGQLIFGSAHKTSGKIIFKGKEINPKNPRQAIDLGIALVPEDRKRHGILAEISVKNNINMPIYKKISRMSVIQSKKEVENATTYQESLLIKTPTIHQSVKNLSGGNQQKVILGRWLAANSELIIFDEPTRGIDVGAKFEIYKLINSLVESGKTIILISSEMEAYGHVRQIIVLAEGRIAENYRETNLIKKRLWDWHREYRRLKMKSSIVSEVKKKQDEDRVIYHIKDKAIWAVFLAIVVDFARVSSLSFVLKFVYHYASGFYVWNRLGRHDVCHLTGGIDLSTGSVITIVNVVCALNGENGFRYGECSSCLAITLGIHWAP